MRMVNDTAVIERNNVGTETEFGIQFSAKMARILSKQIYSNVIQAPIREIICNAWDSQRAAGKSHVKIQVHLPNTLEPWFEVQDQGLGLSPDAMTQVYTQYGGTTKSDNNQDIGGLGLGCKAPFAYTDAFTVTSVWNGTQYNYSLFKNERGIPTLSCMGSAPTQATNGVTVRMPVRSADFDRFRKEAEQVLRWFPDEFEVSGNNRYVRPVPAKVEHIQGKGWYLQESDYYERGPSLAVMGHVAYPLQSDQLNKRFASLLDSCYVSVVCEFEIGELDISPTREELSYDDVTVKVIEHRLDQILQSCRAQIELKLREAPNMWEARCMVNSWRSGAMHTLVQVFMTMGMQLTWQGHAVDKNTIYMNETPGISKDNPPASVMLMNETVRGRSVSYVGARSNCVFVDADCTTASARVRKAYYGKSGRVYMISGTAEQRAHMIAHLGSPSTVKASSLPPADRKVMPFKGHAWYGTRDWGRRTKSECWDSEVQLTTDQGGFYVTQSHWDPISENDDVLNMTTMVDMATKLGILASGVKIWGINKTNCKLIADNKAWIRFDEWFRDQITAQLTDVNLQQSFHVQQQIFSITHHVNMSPTHFRNMLNKHWGNMLNPVGRFARAFTDAVSKQPNPERVQWIRSAARVLNMQVPEVHGVNLYDMWQDCERAYPLIKLLHGNTNDDTWAHMGEYVQLMDVKSQNLPQAA